MDFSKVINEWCKTDNSLAKDLCKAGVVIDFMLTIVFYIIVFIVLSIKLVI